VCLRILEGGKDPILVPRLSLDLSPQVAARARHRVPDRGRVIGVEEGAAAFFPWITSDEPVNGSTSPSSSCWSPSTTQIETNACASPHDHSQRRAAAWSFIYHGRIQEF
jgi:hypothetical protein